MSRPLRDMPVLVIDGQAGGASPAYGDLLELGWAEVGRTGLVGPVRSHWIVPRTGRRVSRAVRELTGWSEACLGDAIDEARAWTLLRDEARRIAGGALTDVPTIIHFARFELPFLRDLHARLAASDEFPLDVVCVHAVAARLFPDLPRRNIRALAGHLGHAPTLLRRAAGHVEATAFIWGALLPTLEGVGVHTWDELKAWCAAPSTARRSARRVFPLAVERRRALPDRPGVYRFVRRNGDVIYVGKAASLRKRVASHFTARGRTTERALEMLTQVDDLRVTETGSVLEAALLEVDEIKRLDPPYNVQLRHGERSAWFASRDLREALPQPDDAHPIGPLPSERALVGLSALIALSEGAEPSSYLRAVALAVPIVFVPEVALFREGFAGFCADLLDPSEPSVRRRVEDAGRALWLARGRQEPEATSDDTNDVLWDLARVRRRLERTLVQTCLLARRARWLALLADAQVAFCERGAERARLLSFVLGQVAGAESVADVSEVTRRPPARPHPLRARQRAFDAATYDRMRVLATELARVQAEGGKLTVRVAGHALTGARLAALMSAI